jgi:formate hydrogenlyase subunit 3/multisubunit Na+/H+ antiporter MnhD subunit
MLFRLAARQTDQSLALTMQVATHRFSTLGLVAVGALLATGFVNTWVLVGGLSALLESGYGRLLLLKIALFMAMVAIASLNRFRLTPRLPRKDSMRLLARNVLVEIGLGLAIVAVASVLGTLPPALHTGMHMHSAVPTRDRGLCSHQPGEGPDRVRLRSESQAALCPLSPWERTRLRARAM